MDPREEAQALLAWLFICNKVSTAEYRWMYTYCDIKRDERTRERQRARERERRGEFVHLYRASSQLWLWPAHNIFAYDAEPRLVAAPGCRLAHPFDREPARSRHSTSVTLQEQIFFSQLPARINSRKIPPLSSSLSPRSWQKGRNCPTGYAL